MTKIEWADKTINPLVGCARVSRACKNCYAADVAFNIEHVLVKAGNTKPRANYQGVSKKDKDGRPNWTNRVNYDPSVMQRLSPGQAPQRFFVNSMSDFFHPAVKLEWLQEIFSHFARCPQHTFLILTKRPENALEAGPGPEMVGQCLDGLHGGGRHRRGHREGGQAPHDPRSAALHFSRAADGGHRLQAGPDRHRLGDCWRRDGPQKRPG